MHGEQVSIANEQQSVFVSRCLCVCVGAKYCPLLESEGGLSLLEPIAQNGNARFRQVQHLAQQIIRRCSQFRLLADAQSTEDLSADVANASAQVNHMDTSDDNDDDVVMGDESDDDSGLDY